MAIRSFADAGTEDVFNGDNTKAARKVCPVEIRSIAERKLDIVNNAATLADLKSPPGNRLEALHGDRKGQHSIRINERYRICFVWQDSGDADDVEIVDYH